MTTGFLHCIYGLNSKSETQGTSSEWNYRWDIHLFYRKVVLQHRHFKLTVSSPALIPTKVSQR